MEQARRADEGCSDIAANIEDDEGIAVFERLRRASRLFRGDGERAFRQRFTRKRRRGFRAR